MLPLLAVSVHSVERMQELAKANQRLTERQLIGLQIGFGVVSRLERLEEYWRKYTVSQDAGYVGKFEEILQVTQEELQNLMGAELSSGQERALGEFVARFRAFSALSLADRASDPERVFEELRQLTSMAAGVHAEARRLAEVEAEAAALTRETTLRAAVFAGAAAALLSALLVLLTTRSLSSRLQPFILGTRAVSKGEFSVQLDARADDELGQVAEAFNHMVQALEQLERIKADFISSVSHELRTPLVAMVETNQLLLDEVLGPLSEKQQRLLRINNQAVQRLSNMITDLLELSRLKSEIRYTMSEQEIGTLTRSAVSELEAMALDRNIALSAECHEKALRVRCDPDRYVQVVQNLVENALKYTPGGGRVRVQLSRKAARDLPSDVFVGNTPRDCALLSVEDSGPGIPVADRQRVFEKFFRREGLPSDGGVGLGLAICREVVQAHGGTVWVSESRSLGGAALHVALPLEGVPQRVRRTVTV
jgi:signal transduction histidine kinase